MMTAQDRLNAWETQCAIAFVLRKARSQGEAEKGGVAAAIAVTIATRGPVAAVDFFRDLADLIERDAVLPPGEVLQ
jgi:hypothetical protein